jgi:hypothetical protein
MSHRFDRIGEENTDNMLPHLRTRPVHVTYTLTLMEKTELSSSFPERYNDFSTKSKNSVSTPQRVQPAIIRRVP